MFIDVYSLSPPSILTDAQWEWLSRHRVSVTSIRPLFALVWVSFPLLPIHFRAKSSLFAIAKYIGAPLCVDKATSNLRRASEAWVCIEVDLKYKLPGRIWTEKEKMMAIGRLSCMTRCQNTVFAADNLGTLMSIVLLDHSLHLHHILHQLLSLSTLLHKWPNKRMDVVSSLVINGHQFT